MAALNELERLRLAREVAMFGVPTADVLDGFDEAGLAPADAVFSMLSDVQELVAAGAMPERIRMALNRVKLLLDRRVKPLATLGERTIDFTERNPLASSELNQAVALAKEARQ